jgi:glycosyltransferase involved in cell wall biosynthesis
MKKIVLFSNTCWSLYNFRLNLIKKLLDKNYKIFILSNRDFTTNKLIKLGCAFRSISLSRRGVDYIDEIKCLLKIFSLIKKINPKFLFNFTIKPIIYGSLVSRLLKIKTLNTLDGLGSTYDVSIFKKFIINLLIKISQKNVSSFYFVNSNNLNFFIKKNFLTKKKSKLIPGTGIDLKYFRFHKNQFSKKTKFLLISRLLYSKGVMDYIKSAKQVSNEFENKVEFTIAGKTDNSIYDSIPKNILEKEAKNSNVKIFYNVKDVRGLIKKTNCVILPTSYNEGLPRSLLESASIGRPLITTNMPGCLRIAKNNFNAFTYNPFNKDELTKKIIKFILLKKNKKIKMSKNSNIIAKKFDVIKIIKFYSDFLNHE